VSCRRADIPAAELATLDRIVTDLLDIRRIYVEPAAADLPRGKAVLQVNFSRVHHAF
jgi:hypothetical protein